MIATVSDSKKHLLLHYETMMEQRQMNISFTRKIRDWTFRTKGKRWKGDVEFIKGNQLPIGMWDEAKKICDKFNFPFKVKGLTDMFCNVSYQEIQDFYDANISNPVMEERPMQIDSVYRAIKYRFCMLDFGTSGGKTAVEYMYLIYLFKTKRIKKVLIVCPDMPLVVQTHEEFVSYSKGRYNLNMCMVHGGTKIHDVSNHNIVIGNFQTLANRDPEFFKDFDCLIIDEAHRAGNTSTKFISDSCVKATFKLGLSGSYIEDRSAEHYTLLAYIGPIVKHITKREIIDAGYATDIEVKIFKLNYLSEENRKKLYDLKFRIDDGEKRLRIEQSIIRQSKMRLKWVCNLIAGLNANTIVFFLDVKTEYGKNIMRMIKEINPSKEVYYIDGDTNGDLRTTIKNRMEDGNNKILVASYDTFSTGKSIKNLHYIACAEGRKGEVVVSQFIGRGMRLHADKEVCTLLDIVDDFSLDLEDGYRWQNYAIKHMLERIKYYESEKFKFKIEKIEISENKSSLKID